jgi:hypothetical protein
VENLYEALLKTVSENERNFNAWKDSIVNMVNSMAKRECEFTTREEFEEELKLHESMIAMIVSNQQDIANTARMAADKAKLLNDERHNQDVADWKAAIATASRRYALPMGLRAIKSKKYNPIGTSVFAFLILSLTVAFVYTLFV